MGIGAAASLPWKDIVMALPGVAQTATELWKKWKSGPQPGTPGDAGDPHAQIAAIVERLEALEQAEAIQSDITKQITDQLQALSAGLGEASRRANTALLVAAGSSVLAAVALVALAIALLR